jgi:hypothetical protein
MTTDESIVQVGRKRSDKTTMMAVVLVLAATTNRRVIEREQVDIERKAATKESRVHRRRKCHQMKMKRAVQMMKMKRVRAPTAAVVVVAVIVVIDNIATIDMWRRK